MILIRLFSWNTRAKYHCFISDVIQFLNGAQYSLSFVLSRLSALAMNYPHSFFLLFFPLLFISLLALATFPLHDVLAGFFFLFYYFHLLIRSLPPRFLAFRKPSSLPLHYFWFRFLFFFKRESNDIERNCIIFSLADDSDFYCKSIINSCEQQQMLFRNTLKVYFR